MGDHGRGGNAVARRHAAEVERFFDVLLVAHPARDAGSLLRCIGQDVADLRFVQSGKRSRGRGGAEHRPEAVRRMPVVAELAGIERQRQPAAYVVAERNRAQQRRPVAPLALGHGERRGHNAAARMRQRRRMRIVGLVGMSQHAVRQRGVGGRRDDAAAGHASFLGAAERAHEGNRFFPGQQAGTGQHRRDRVEQVVLGLLDNWRRQRLVQRLRDVGA